MSQYASGYLNPLTAFPPVSNPLLGGSLSIGPTGLGGIGGLPGLNGGMPYASPLGSLFRGSAGAAGLPSFNPQAFNMSGPIRGLAGQVGPGVGADAARSALALGEAGGGAAPSVAGSAGGLGARLASTLPTFNPGELSGGALARSVLGRGALGFTVGSLGSSAVDALNPGGQNSNIEQGLQGASIGAGVGGAIGAPLFGIGAVPGALIGGAAGGALGVLSNIFGGGGEGDDKQADPVTVLATAMNSANLDPDMHEQILTTYETLMALAEGVPEGDARDAARQQAFDQTSAMVLQAMQTQQAAPAAASNTLALQAQAQQIFEPIAQDIETNANLYAQAMGGIRPNLPDSYRAVSDATVARELTSADKLANAYRAQAALTPIAQQLTRYQQDQDAFAQQMWSQQLAQQAAGINAGGAGGLSNSDLLTQLAG